ncbi:hypothetical protein ARALYDRAFT_494743 [Arabidopsis lyrata subsp. lyrata]|uniref:Uncharacterized protein n=1 Tax=Arabidopsis lyrata subsp. lyrata TaxID=81972 RepID=D7MRF3_ARALL|nr:uncharacterized protein LOC9299813 [Arabidopsis lyrata subsp. lyrata]EFH39996.1 hypothetical protein ARALYDRAFT_494743 [Arabidopsis lyrata subsp. lyrata]|eukprot:XP_020871202.1 uncharacterized protein LOC9299813 [Arabidopsis lyrata subsp. lyrata]
MKGRAYVMIFFFWALLTIITPMLVSWSQALKNLPPLSHDQEQKIKDTSPRRMMGYTEEMHLAQEFVSHIKEEKLMMVPSMAPTPEDNPVTLSLPFLRKKQQDGLVVERAHPIRLQ